MDEFYVQFMWIMESSGPLKSIINKPIYISLQLVKRQILNACGGGGEGGRGEFYVNKNFLNIY